ncbi:MAG: mannose-1-phosphate guanylyltransferase/mannose-6-phosphate isomerase, partial [Pseudomonadota bacterium]
METSGKIIPLILTGGSGTRLWPLSRASRPKQFLSFGKNKSLFQQTMLRCQGAAFHDSPIIVGSHDNRFLIAEDMRDIGVEGDIILEPVARNSCAAVAAGCKAAIGRDPEAVVMVLAADHAIQDGNEFRSASAKALDAAFENYLITFGIRPTKPSTGYGYIKAGEEPVGENTFRVKEFREKPGENTAKTFISEGYLWNSGNFLFKASAFLEELSILEPELEKGVGEAVRNARKDLDFLLLSEPHFSAVKSISIDYAVMEKTARAAVHPVDYGWSDLGTWQSIQETFETDAAGNSVFGDTAIVDSHGSFIHSEHTLTTLVGVRDLIVVNTRDALLVCNKNKSEEIKQLVEKLKENDRPEATETLRIFRPWGNYERLDVGEGFQVKRIVVVPGGMLSLQRHKHRAEHWVVVEGEAEVTIDDTVCVLKPNQSTYTPLGSVHRLAN